MLCAARRHYWLMTLLYVALFTVQAGRAHLHLCLDGGEPAASLHMADSGLHHTGPGTTDAGHQDIDLTLVGVALTGSGVLDSSLPLALLAVVLLRLLRLLPQSPRQLLSGYRPPFLAPAAQLLHPPLRGPPLPISL